MTVAVDDRAEQVAVWCVRLATAATAEDARTIGLEAVTRGWATRRVLCRRAGCLVGGRPWPMTATGASQHVRQYLELGIAHAAADLVPAEFPAGIPDPGEPGPPPPAPAAQRPRWSIASCRACRAPIVWGQTEKGRRMPVDADVSDAGTFVLVASEFTDPGVPLLMYDAAGTAPNRHVPHWVTCPNADRHRRRRR